MRRALPEGLVTLLFTDVERSTRLLRELGPQGYAQALDEHRRVLREAFVQHGGVEVDTQGDAFFVAFERAEGAVATAERALAGLADTPIRIRIGIHTGTPQVTGEGYVGEDVHLGARIAAAGHGGQVLVSAATRTLVDGELIELGEHRLKDFSEPVVLYQLGSERFAPLKTLSNTNLPRPASSFVGRERELGELVALLRDGVRLLTLSGPGGSGKTRLAIEAAAELVGEFKAGVFWVGLASVRDPALVLETVVQTLGAKDGLAEWIGERELLLLLDNLEQVVDAAPELGTLVESCPHLKLLVTSRELLKVRGEVEYSVPPLSDPEAVELFCARARVEPDETVAELCRRLDNLPLALELAAARTKALSPAQILGRLAQRLDLLKGGRDSEARQQTLRATIAWSYELLDAEEQRLFARLAVFRGGCTLEAAEDVLDAVLDLLQSLVEKSLVRHTQERFWMLETIREFALECLEKSGAANELRRSHAEHFLDLAEEAYPHLTVSPKEWLDGLEADHDNLRAALDHLEATGDLQRGLQLAGALHRFWYMHGHVREGRGRIERLLAADPTPTGERARALDGASVLAVTTADAATGRARAEEALALQRRFGDEWGATYSEFMLAMAAGEEEDFETARDLMAKSAERFRELGDDYSSQRAAGNLGYFLQELGEFDAARELLEGVLGSARAAGAERNEAGALGQLAEVAREQGRGGHALAFLEQSLPIWARLGDLHMAARDLRRAAHVLVEMGTAESAARLLAASETLREQAGSWESWNARVIEKIRVLARETLGEPAFERAWSEGRALSLEEAVALALCVMPSAAPSA